MNEGYQQPKLSAQALEARDWVKKRAERVAALNPSAKKIYKDLEGGPYEQKDSFAYRGEISRAFMDGTITPDEEAAFKVYMEEVGLRQHGVSNSYYGSAWETLWKNDKFRAYAKSVVETNSIKYSGAEEILRRHVPGRY